MMDADGRRDSAVTAGVRSAWKKLREYLSTLSRKGFLLASSGCCGIMAISKNCYGGSRQGHSM